LCKFSLIPNLLAHSVVEYCKWWKGRWQDLWTNAPCSRCTVCMCSVL